MNNKIKLIIFDLDGTLYPKTEAYYEADYEALAHVVNEINSEISKNEAYKLAKEGKKKYGKTYDIFLEEKGISFEELDKKFLTRLVDTIPQFLTESKELKLNLQKINEQGIKIVLFTHNQKAFIEKALEALDIRGFFKDGSLFCKENMEQKKNEGTKTFETIARQFNIDYENILMVDDEDINLIFPKKLGMRTILITEQDIIPRKNNPNFSPYKEYKNISEFFKNFNLFNL
jgi:FMN phosphatase YigB (HAD superfamily)